MEQLTGPGWLPRAANVAAGGYARGHVRAGGKAWAAIGVGVGALAASAIGLIRGEEPYATGFYLFAWYSTLLVLYGALALTGGRSPRLRRPLSLLSMLAWSAVFWLFFELLNFRLRDWYYVFVPADPLLRWADVLLAFATVLPAIFGAEALLDARGAFERVRWPRVRVTPVLLRRLRVAGVLALVLPMLWPRYFFPLVWGATTLLLEPSVYLRDRSRSLLAELEQGRPARLLRLLAGGAAIGFLWELFNIGARGKWIYTVPFFEEAKLFEMPVLGFLGFPPFAVDCWVAWQLLVLGGVAVPLDGSLRPASLRRRLGAALTAAAFAVVVLAGMERLTISSTTPGLVGLPGVPAARLAEAGYDVFSLAAAAPAQVVARTGATRAAAGAWVAEARLATLRGIGDGNARRLAAVGIRDVAALAASDPGRLAASLRAASAAEVVDARVRVWVRAARRVTGIRQATTSTVPASPGRSSPMTAAAGA